MASMTEVGTKLILEGLAGYLSGTAQAAKATENIGKSASDASKHAEGFSVKAGALAVALGNTLSSAAALAGRALVGLGKELIGATLGAAEEDLQLQKLQTVITNTGKASWTSAEQIQAMGTAYQKTTRYTDNMVVSASAALLKFENMGQEVFPQALEITLNMAEAMRMDATTAAQQLGKALEVPGEGLMRLKNMGVSFTKAEEDQIDAMQKAGKTAEAQKAIMDALSKTYKGVAVAAGQTAAGKIKIFQNQLDDLKENIGAKFLPVIITVMDKVMALLENPAIQAGINNIITFVGDLVLGIMSLVEGISKIDFSGAFSFISSEGPKIGEAITKIVTKVQEIAGPLVREVMNWFSQKWAEIGNWFTVNGPLINTFIELLKKTVEENFKIIWTAINDAWTLWIKPAFDGILKIIGDIAVLIMQVATGDWTSAWATIQSIATTAKETILTVLGGLVTWLQNTFIGVVNSVTNAFNSVKQAVEGAINAIKTFLSMPQPTATSYGQYGATQQTVIPNSSRAYGRASGGDVRRNSPYIIGERGPELFIPQVSGMVMPNAMMNGLMSLMQAPSTVYNNTTINYNLGVTTTQSSAAVQRSFAMMQLLAG